jgi:hypothetical protein
LLLFFFRSQGRVQLKHPFGQLHVYLLVLEIYAFQLRFGVRDIVALAALGNNQQRRFASPKPNVFNLADLATRVENYATDQVADVIPSRFKLRPLGARNLQLTTNQHLRIGDRIDARELQNQVPLVRPEFFNLQFAPAVILRKSEQLQANSKPVRNVAVQLDCDFATTSLRFPHARQGDELAADS